MALLLPPLQDRGLLPPPTTTSAPPSAAPTQTAEQPTSEAPSRAGRSTLFGTCQQAAQQMTPQQLQQFANLFNMPFGNQQKVVPPRDDGLAPAHTNPQPPSQLQFF